LGWHSKFRAVPNSLKAGEAEQFGHEETSRTGTELEHEKSDVYGRDEAGGAVVLARCVDRMGLDGGQYWPPAVCARDHDAHLFPAAVVRPVGPDHCLDFVRDAVVP
jgi:hypothetical protein